MSAPVELVEQTMTVTDACERADLSRRLRYTRGRLLDPNVRVLVVGEFKQGKSQLVNALIGASVCPVDDDIATSVSTVVMHAAEPTASLVFAPKGERDLDGPPPERRPVPIEELAAHVSEAGNPGNEKQLLCAEVGLPRQVLAGGLVIVDTPGVGGLGSAHAANTMAALPTADAVLLVSDAAQEYSEPEIEFLRQALKLCPNLGCVLTKTDLYPHWKRIAELDRVHLDGAGVTAQLLPVSSQLRLHAVRANDTELNTESGFPDLIRFLRSSVLAQADRLARQSTVHDVMQVTEHVRLSLRTELGALQDPERNQAVIVELEAARQRADDLRKQTARWQQTLNDGVADLNSDIDYDLRDRTRRILRDAEEAIDGVDPGTMWDQFAEWLDQQVAATVTANFVWAHERSQWLAVRVSEHFAELAQQALPDVRVAETEGVLDPVIGLDDIDDGKLGLGNKMLIGLRGSYGGVLMVGLVTTFLAGMVLINPISIGAGALLGAKAYKEEMANRLKRRRSEAKAAVRKQLDDVVFQVSKESKDRLRQVQRVLRDHFAEQADELHRSLTDSVTAAQKAAKTDSSQRERRIRDITLELQRIDQLQRQARDLLPSAQAAKQKAVATA
ncbi:MAG: dynamin family protein [Pseudonocardia sp.]